MIVPVEPVACISIDSPKHRFSEPGVIVPVTGNGSIWTLTTLDVTNGCVKHKLGQASLRQRIHQLMNVYNLESN